MLGLAEIVAIIIGIFLGMAAWKRGSKAGCGHSEFLSDYLFHADFLAGHDHGSHLCSQLSDGCPSAA